MRSILTFSVFLALSISAMAETADTLKVQPGDIDMKALQKGNYSYIVYTKKTKDGSSGRMTLIKINVEQQLYHNRPAIIIKQRWERDTIVHSAYSVFSTKDFSTIVHNSWWKSLGYTMNFDFEAKRADYKNDDANKAIADSVIRKGTADFNDSFAKYNLNWHADLIVYQLLPYKDNRTFVVNYYDPGFGKAVEVDYTVTGSEILTGRNGEKTDCWVLNHVDKHDPDGYERFWIAKKSKEVLKEEDFFAKRGYRYKVKLGISGDN
jgi:hypothetical protein